MNLTSKAFACIVIASTISCVRASSNKSDKLAPGNLGKMVTFLHKKMLNASGLQTKIEVLNHAIIVLEAQIAQRKQPPVSAAVSEITGYMGQFTYGLKKSELDPVIASVFNSCVSTPDAKASQETYMTALETKRNVLITVRNTLNKLVEYLSLQDASAVAAPAKNQAVSEEEFTATIAKDLEETMSFLKISQACSKNGKYIASGAVEEYTISDLFNKADNPLKLVCPTLSFNSKSQAYLGESELGDALYKQTGATDRFIQIRVKNQMDEDGAGPASCAYQSLINGLIITRLLLSDHNQRSLLLYELQSGMLRMNLFGRAHASWRQHVIKERKKTCIQQFIYTHFRAAALLTMESELTPAELSQFNSTLMNVLSELVGKLPLDIYKNKISLGTEIVTHVQKQLGDKCEKLKQLIESFFKMPSHVQRIVLDYLDVNRSVLTKFGTALHDMRRLKYDITDTGISEKQNTMATDLHKFKAKLTDILPDIVDMNEEELLKMCRHMCALPENKWKNYLSRSANTRSLPGEWLDSAEVNPLIKFEQTHGSLLSGIDMQTVKIIEITVPDGNDKLSKDLIQQNVRKSHELVDPEPEIRPDIKEIIDLIQNLSAQGIRIILFRLPGHWITCVVNKIAGRQAQYIFTDSIDHERLSEARVKELINFLEGSTPKEDQSSGGPCVIS